jgi:60 kDa SS-A/Ro ribonucleoprotein
MRTNTARKFDAVTTEGGAPAYPHLKPIDQLRRTVLACMLWEGGFYEDGQTVADRIKTLVAASDPLDVHKLAIEARSEQNLRHVPLLLAVQLARGTGRSLLTETLPAIIQRADELTEFVSLYWADGKVPLAAAVKKGLAAAFRKFDGYSLAKYNRDDAIKLRDVLFLCHAKPKDEVQAETWKHLVDGTLRSPDTWEVALSTGGDKKEEFTRLLTEGKLGYLALLRNLRGMTEAGVDTSLIRDAILARKGGAEKVLPFRFVAAARACPRLEPSLDESLSQAIAALPPLPGTTAVLVDVSGSMDAKISAKSDMSRMDAACALASLINGDVRMFSFSNQVVEVPPRRGMAGVDALLKSQSHGGTALAEAVHAVNTQVKHDRLIVITDEQSTSYGRTPDPVASKAYMVNIASNKNGVGYGKWTHLDGWSESIIRWITESERAG